jgi:hypothetical protein
VSRNCSSGGTPHAPVISARQLSSQEKRKYERTKTFAEFLDTVGYGDGSGLLQQCGRASEIQSSGFGVQHPDNLGMAMAPIETVKGFQVGFITRKLLKIWRREWESNSVKNVVSTA